MSSHLLSDDSDDMSSLSSGEDDKSIDTDTVSPSETFSSDSWDNPKKEIKLKLYEIQLVREMVDCRFGVSSDRSITCLQGGMTLQYFTWTIVKWKSMFKGIVGLADTRVRLLTGSDELWRCIVVMASKNTQHVGRHSQIPMWTQNLSTI